MGIALAAVISHATNAEELVNDAAASTISFS
jgi:hypothetical protein